MEAGFAVFTARFTPDFRQVVFQVEIKRQKEKKNVLELASGVFFELKKSDIWKSDCVLCGHSDLAQLHCDCNRCV